MYLFTESYTCARSECCAVFTEYIAGVNDVEFNLSSVQEGNAVQFLLIFWEGEAGKKKTCRSDGRHRRP